MRASQPHCAVGVLSVCMRRACACAPPSVFLQETTGAGRLLGMPENDSDSDDDRTIFAICSAALNEAALTDDPHLLHLQALERELAAKTVQLADCEARLRACAGPALVFRCIGTQTGDVGSESVAAGACAAASVAAPAAKRRLPTTRGSTAASRREAPPGPPPCPAAAS